MLGHVSVAFRIVVRCVEVDHTQAGQTIARTQHLRNGEKVTSQLELEGVHGEGRGEARGGEIRNGVSKEDRGGMWDCARSRSMRRREPLRGGKRRAQRKERGDARVERKDVCAGE